VHRGRHGRILPDHYAPTWRVIRSASDEAMSCGPGVVVPMHDTDAVADDGRILHDTFSRI
jgi:hypothetical protein